MKMKHQLIMILLMGVLIGVIGSSIVIDTTRPNDAETVHDVRNIRVESGGASSLDLTNFMKPQGTFDTELSLRIALSNVVDAEVLDATLLLIENQFEIAPILRSKLLAILSQRLAITDPKIAIEITDILDPSSRAKCIEHIFLEWASSDLYSAVASAQTLKDLDRVVALRAILSARWDLLIEEHFQIAEQMNLEYVAVEHLLNYGDLIQLEDLKFVWEKIVSTLTLEQLTDWLPELRELAKRWLEKDGLEVLHNLLDSLGSVRLQQAVLNPLIYEQAIEDPQAIFQQTFRWNIEFYQDARRLIVSQWGYADPLAAFDTVYRLEFSRHKFDLQKTAVDFLHDGDSVILDDYLDKFPPSLRTWAHYRYVIDRDDPNSIYFITPYERNWYDQ